MPRYQIEHRTRFEYDGAVRESVMELRMRPREDDRQTCARFALSISPQATLSEYVDPYGNVVHYFTLPRPHDSLEVLAQATVDDSRVRLEAGLANRNDLTRTDLELATARLASTRAENLVATSRLALGFLMKLALGSPVLGPEGRAALGIGFCGAFTTFSTLAYESATLIEDGRWLSTRRPSARSIPRSRRA